MKRLSTSTALARQRRERYFELRRGGLSPRAAATETGVNSSGPGRLYEHWYQATERGERIVPGKCGGRKPGGTMPP